MSDETQKKKSTKTATRILVPVERFEVEELGLSANASNAEVVNAVRVKAGLSPRMRNLEMRLKAFNLPPETTFTEYTKHLEAELAKAQRMGVNATPSKE